MRALFILSSFALGLLISTSFVSAQSSSESFRVIDSINFGSGTSQSESFRALELVDDLDELIYYDLFVQEDVIVTDIETIIERIVNNPTAIAAKNVLPPIVLGTAILLSIAPFLFKIPSGLANLNMLKSFWRFLFGWVGKKKKSGFVFDSATGKGVEGASVRLISEGGGNFEPGKVVGVTVTDETGHYSFKVAPGKYRLETTAMNYEFPSKRRREDYHGEIIDTGERDHFNPDIPVDSFDPQAIVRTRSLKNLGVFLDMIRLPMMTFGTVLSIVFYIHYGFTIDLVILTMYLLLWIMELGRLHHAHFISRIYSPTGPVHNATVRLLDFEGHLLSTSVSQRSGEFTIFVPAGIHRLQVTKFGFEEAEQIIKTSESQVVKRNVRLRPVH